MLRPVVDRGLGCDIELGIGGEMRVGGWWLML
jgi:hypothetical protein